MVRELLQVLLLLSHAVPKLEELLLLALLDGIVLVGALALLEGVAELRSLVQVGSVKTLHSETEQIANSHLTASLGRGTGITSSQESGTGNKSRAGRQGARAGELGEGSAHHFA